jgi:hypothetical protein
MSQGIKIKLHNGNFIKHIPPKIIKTTRWKNECMVRACSMNGEIKIP